MCQHLLQSPFIVGPRPSSVHLSSSQSEEPTVHCDFAFPFVP